MPLQIAAERGLPALAIWCGSWSRSLRDFLRQRRTSSLPFARRRRLACVVAMLAAGMFEYNFGDSEFLMLFLVLVTLPYAADRAPSRPPTPRGALTADAALETPRPTPARAPVLVVGDLMLDHFVIGTVDRISPEAPGAGRPFEHETYRLGGAANVAHNVARSAAASRPSASSAATPTAARLRAALSSRRIGTAGIVAIRRAARRASCAS